MHELCLSTWTYGRAAAQAHAVVGRDFPESVIALVCNKERVTAQQKTVGGREGCSVGRACVSLIAGISQSGYGCNIARWVNAAYAMVKAVSDISGAKSVHNHGGRESQMRIAR